MQKECNDDGRTKQARSRSHSSTSTEAYHRAKGDGGSFVVESVILLGTPCSTKRRDELVELVHRLAHAVLHAPENAIRRRCRAGRDLAVVTSDLDGGIAARDQHAARLGRPPTLHQLGLVQTSNTMPAGPVERARGRRALRQRRGRRSPARVTVTSLPTAALDFRLPAAVRAWRQ